MLILRARAPVVGQLFQALQHLDRFADGVDGAALAPVWLGHIRVARPAKDRDGAVQAAAHGHQHVQIGRLGDQGCVGLVAPLAA